MNSTGRRSLLHYFLERDGSLGIGRLVQFSLRRFLLSRPGFCSLHIFCESFPTFSSRGRHGLDCGHLSLLGCRAVCHVLATAARFSASGSVLFLCGTESHGTSNDIPLGAGDETTYARGAGLHIQRADS